MHHSVSWLSSFELLTFFPLSFTFEWMKEYYFVHRWQFWLLYLSPLLSLSHTLHPSCFPSCECDRHWSVEAYNDARRNARARALDEKLLGVCECQVPPRPVGPPLLPVVCVALARVRQSTLLLCIATTASKLHLFCSEIVLFFLMALFAL